ncbi:hypothetical protein G7046_g4401 [Stylonectria norvegica]|nr:hypothetical protein G7046_g4401 [Stylonectria norvegica]
MSKAHESTTIADDWERVETVTSVVSIASELPSSPSSHKDERNPSPQETSRSSESVSGVGDRSYTAANYHQALSTLISPLEATIEAATSFVAWQSSTAANILQLCRQLLSRLNRVLPMYAGLPYADMADFGVPLNPEILSWVIAVKLRLESAQAEFRKLQPSVIGSHEDKGTIGALNARVASLVTLPATLRALEDNVKTFYAIIPLGDAVPSPRTVEAEPHIRSEPAAPRRVPPNLALFKIRSELYNLKDQLKRLSTFFNEFDQLTSPPPVLDDTGVVQRMLDLTGDVTIILTNGDEDWMEHEQQRVMCSGNGVRKVLSFADFLKLEPEMIRGAVEHLKQCVEEWDVRQDPEFRKYSDKELRIHQVEMLTTKGGLRALHKSLEVLESLLVSEMGG